MTRNGGEVQYTGLTKPRQHPYRKSSEWNEHGFTIAQDERYHTSQKAKLNDLASRTIDSQPIPAIIPIIGTPELNNNMWIDLQKKLRDEEIELLIEDIEFEKGFTETKEYWEMDSEERTMVMKPYLMTENLIAEAICLSQEWRNGQVKLIEPRSGTKDIIVSFAYGNYISTKIIDTLTKQDEEEDISEDDFYEIYNY